MIEIININSKDTRAFGWVQDASSISSLYNVVSIFDKDSCFHKTLLESIIPMVVEERDGRQLMIEALSKDNISLKYKMLSGTAFFPRSESRCNGIVQAAVKGQKRAFIGDWPADNYIRWAHATGFIKYNYCDDTFSITEKGLELTHADKTEIQEILTNAILSYPPAYRVLSLLKNPEDAMTKFEIGEQLGFTGEQGFVCYPVKSIIAALAECADSKERAKIHSDWESSSDKYARTISRWLNQLGLVTTCEKEITIEYGHRLVSDTLGAICITPKGEKLLRNIDGNSKHSKIQKNVSYEMFATKGADREYLRLRRSLILKFLVEQKKATSLKSIQNYLKSMDLEESEETITDDLIGFNNLGINIDINEKTITLIDKICDFQIPVYKDITEKSTLSKEKDEIRKKLTTLSHEYLSLLDLAFDSNQNRLFEIKVMDLFLNECGFYGRHLGGANKPDGVLYTDDDKDQNYGIIVDMKAYSGGYNLPISQQDEMRRYIEDNQTRNIEINATEWWKEFPDYLKNYYFMFVSGSFKGDIAEKLNKIYLKTKVSGTALAIVNALLVADEIKSKKISRQEFSNKILNSEYTL